MYLATLWRERKKPDSMGRPHTAGAEPQADWLFLPTQGDAVAVVSTSESLPWGHRTT